MDFTLLPVSFLAGILTILAPCVLPILPIIIGGSLEEKSIKRPIIITLSLAFSIVFFTLILKFSTIFIDIPQDFWKYFSGFIILFFAFSLLFPGFYTKILSKISTGKFKKKFEKIAFLQSKKNTNFSAIILGASLGPIFAACSPTYFLILSTVLPASFFVGILNLFAFSLGLSLVMFLVAFSGQKIMKKLNVSADPKSFFKKFLGILFLIVAFFVLTGYDKKIESYIVKNGYLGITEFENNILEKREEKNQLKNQLKNQEENQEENKEKKMEKNIKNLEEKNLAKAYFAGGCFWCIEAPFEEKPGIYKAVSGYMGGDKNTANYRDVSSGSTQHREAVEISYNPEIVSYRMLVKTFWYQIDPTDPEGQFADKGFQYTTAIYYGNEEEKKIAEEERDKLIEYKKFEKEIATKILPISEFFVAEEYHQDYYKKASSHYEAYKKGSGRAGFIEENWAKEAALLESEKELKNEEKNNKKNMNWKDFQKPNEQELKNILTDLQYKVTQKDGTERPFNNEYWDNKEEGIYVDILSGEPLFSSEKKYESGTGWPSFTAPIEGIEIVEKEDFKLFSKRIEVRSKYADSHLGHVFNDGPQDEGGLRYCLNSAALKFIPKSDLEQMGYGEFLKIFE